MFAPVTSRRLMSIARSVPLTLLLIAASATAQPAPADPPADAQSEAPANPPPDNPPPVNPPPVHPPPANPPPAKPVPPAPKPDEDAPTSFKIGSAYITPIGFMDFTGYWRSKTGGSGIGTNFGSIPYGVVAGNELSETRFSMQNSRIGFRVDAPVGGSHVIGYMEADFLGNPPGNLTVSSNSNTLRSRLYWVDVRHHGLELLAGQTWSLITAGKAGISPLPGDLWITSNVDVNYQAGMVWGRIPELRLAYHYDKLFSAAIALDSPEQYIGGSSGGSTITLPASLMALGGTQLDNGTTTTSVPNFLPDVIAKLAIDPSPRFHVEAGGLERQFKIWVPPDDASKFSATGVAGFVNVNIEPIKGLRLMSNNFWGTGGGRYIFGQAPDLIVKSDGHLQTVDAGSTLDGLELTLGNTMVYALYGGIYIDHAVAPADPAVPCTDAASCVGYGYNGAPSSQNKTLEEYTVGFNQTFWKSPKYGALNLMGQYSKLIRTPWNVAVGAPGSARLSMVFLNLRYSLPGAAPKLPD